MLDEFSINRKGRLLVGAGAGLMSMARSGPSPGMKTDGRAALLLHLKYAPVDAPWQQALIVL